MTVPATGVRVSAERPVPRPSPPARRSSRPGWRDPRLTVGVLLLCGSVLLGARVLASADDTVAVWGTRTALSRGQVVSPEDLVPVQVRFAEPETADRYLAADDTLPDGSSLVRDVGGGELLPRDALTRDAADRLVEVPLAVEAAGIPSSMEVGSRVDVWVTPADGGRPAAGTGALRVLSDVPVLADGSSAAAASGFAGELRPVVVGVAAAAQDDLSRVLTELANGAVVLVRRQG